jgi:hypothetical protein
LKRGALIFASALVVPFIVGYALTLITLVTGVELPAMLGFVLIINWRLFVYPHVGMQPIQHVHSIEATHALFLDRSRRWTPSRSG